MDITLTLNPEEVNAILTVFGDLPAKTGIWPLMVKIQQQAQEQVQAAQEQSQAEPAQA